jgi:hypothetical protein
VERETGECTSPPPGGSSGAGFSTGTRLTGGTPLFRSVPGLRRRHGIKDTAPSSPEARVTHFGVADGADVVRTRITDKVELLPAQERAVATTLA